MPYRLAERSFFTPLQLQLSGYGKELPLNFLIDLYSGHKSFTVSIVTIENIKTFRLSLDKDHAMPNFEKDSCKPMY
jgi:hypothetical protein